MQERAIGLPQVQQNKNYWNPRKNCKGKLKGFGRRNYNSVLPYREFPHTLTYRKQSSEKNLW